MWSCVSRFHAEIKKGSGATQALPVVAKRYEGRDHHMYTGTVQRARHATGGGDFLARLARIST